MKNLQQTYTYHILNTLLHYRYFVTYLFLKRRHALEVIKQTAM